MEVGRSGDFLTMDLMEYRRPPPDDVNSATSKYLPKSLPIKRPRIFAIAGPEPKIQNQRFPWFLVSSTEDRQKIGCVA